MTTKKPHKRRPKGAGLIRKLPSGKYQAIFGGGDGKRRSAGLSFETKPDAAAWLTRQQELVAKGTWEPPESNTPDDANPRFAAYAQRWVSDAELKPSTKSLYRRLLRLFILESFKDERLKDITVAKVKAWHSGLPSDTPTQKAHAYRLLRTILNTAYSDDVITSNPCRIRGGGSVETVHKPVVPTVAQIGALADAMPVRLKAAVVIAAWCGLRYGEVTELRRKDVDMDALVLNVERAVTRVDGAFIVGAPKSSAGVRTVAMPHRIADVVAAHLDEYTGAGPDALMFPAEKGGHLMATTFGRYFRRARGNVGLEGLHLHDLRHAAGTFAAETGASQASLKARLGHSTNIASARYQHAVSSADRAIADALDAMDDAKPLRLVK